MPNLLTNHVQVPNQDLHIDAYLAIPAENRTYPAVIVIQEVFGVNEYIRSVCDRIASWGFVTIAPAIFQRTAPGFEVGYSAEELALGRSHKDQTTAAQLISDLEATIDYLRQLPQVQQQSLGIIGFCFGGHVAFLGATLSQIQVAALFYPSGIAVMTPGGGEASLSLAGNIQGQVYGFFGNADPIIPNEQVDQIAAAFEEKGIQHRIFRYEAGHGFACDRRADYNPEAATEAWQHVATLFSELKTEN